MFIALLLIWLICLVLGIVLWVQGSKKRSKGMVIVGGFLCLGIIGLIITIIVTSNWNNYDSYNSYNQGYMDAQQQQNNSQENEGKEEF